MDTQTKGNIPVKTTDKEKAKSTWPALSSISDIDKAIERFFDRRWPSLLRWNDIPAVDTLFEFEGQRLPSLDLIDRDNEVLLRLEIPGIDKKDIQISLADNLLTIKGETSSDVKEEKGDYYRHEISNASFARSVSVPGNVDVDKAVANLKDGVLEIKLPKLESSKRKSIAVQ